SAFAGQTAKLQITSQPYRESGGIVTYLDNIAFSPEPVPEPATLALLELGGALALAGWRGCRRKG
ncbi:MAG: PEP-CTERM sorting domain-containing protein, partial [Verrucomicrobia bacterium]|nr:PEP-CTERM sorting domain-containing protein [Verrucomicrobiota bacterium]